MKAVVAAFNQEKALVGAFSVIVQLHRLIVYSTSLLASTAFIPPLTSVPLIPHPCNEPMDVTEGFRATESDLSLKCSGQHPIYWGHHPVCLSMFSPSVHCTCRPPPSPAPRSCPAPRPTPGSSSEHNTTGHIHTHRYIYTVYSVDTYTDISTQIYTSKL